MHVTVAGGTGFIGRALCGELAERGHTVTAMSRSPAEVELPAGVDTVRADVRDATALADALTDEDALVNLVSLSPLFATPRSLSHDVVHYQGTKHLLEAAEGCGIDRFLQMSALGADPTADTAYLRAKGHAETAVRESECTWTIIRPSVVFGEGSEFLRFCRWLSFPPMTQRLTWPYLIPLPGGNSRFQPIWREDLVSMLADALESPDHELATYELGGPSICTLASIIRMIHRAEGHRARIVPVPISIARLGLTVAEYLPGAPMGVDQARSLGIDNVPSENDIGAFDVATSELMHLESYLGI